MQNNNRKLFENLVSRTKIYIVIIFAWEFSSSFSSIFVSLDKILNKSSFIIGLGKNSLAPILNAFTIVFVE